MSQVESLKERQYGEWLRARGAVRSGSEKGRALDGRNTDNTVGDDARSRPRSTSANVSSSIFSEDDVDGGLNSNNELMVRKALIAKTLTRDSNSNYSEGDSLSKWDKEDETPRGLKRSQEAQPSVKESGTNLVRELFKPNKHAMSVAHLKLLGLVVRNQRS